VNIEHFARRKNQEQQRRDASPLSTAMKCETKRFVSVPLPSLVFLHMDMVSLRIAISTHS
jgi:hypothetical protein